MIALGAGEGAPPPGWSLEAELTDPTADTAPQASFVPVSLQAAQAQSQGTTAPTTHSNGPVPASVEALQRLARALETNVTKLEDEYGYKHGPAPATSGAVAAQD